jgi:hypothetical protein
MHLLLGALLLIAILVVALFGVALAIATMHRSSSHRTSGSLGRAMQEVEGLFMESKRHIIEEQREDKRETGEASGDPPVK